MNKEPQIFLQHILDSIELIEKRTKNICFKEFDDNIDLQDMVIRRLEIIGEAVRNLPEQFREKHSGIDWRNPSAMRNILIHAYFEVDSKIIWNTVANDLPPFKEQIKKLLRETQS